MSDTELRECPMCGGEASHSMDCDETEYPFAIECDECHVCTDRYSDDEMAVAAWNTRVFPTRPEAMVRKLEWFVISVGRRAESLIGPYEVHFDEPRFYVAGPGGFSANVGSEQEAKAAAQTDYEARILSALSLPVIEGDAEGWRTIDSAPKDWSNVLLFDPDYQTDWDKVFEGFYDCDEDKWRDRQCTPVNPTMWRPLPSPPASTTEGGRG